MHSVGAADAELLKQDTNAAKKAQIILNHHTPPEDAAKVFNETKPKLAVFTHMVVVATDPKYPKPTQESIVESTRAAGYDGSLEIAR
ncbi:MAG: MBL fold metallo-hydrolase, partial [Candidatus Accumulibacter sp.]|nr:MBL fold metallo-hydrolase [Accumulibacter sp.]